MSKTRKASDALDAQGEAAAAEAAAELFAAGASDFDTPDPAPTQADTIDGGTADTRPETQADRLPNPPELAGQSDRVPGADPAADPMPQDQDAALVEALLEGGVDAIRDLLAEIEAALPRRELRAAFVDRLRTLGLEEQGGIGEGGFVWTVPGIGEVRGNNQHELLTHLGNKVRRMMLAEGAG